MLQSINQNNTTTVQPVLPSIFHSLRFKLTLAFLLVGLIGALLVAFFVGDRTQSAINQFVVDRGQSTLVTNLAEYYETHGSWEGVEIVVERAGVIVPSGSQGPRRSSLVLVGADGRVVIGDRRSPVGTVVSTAARSQGVAISTEAGTVGWLLNDIDFRRPGPGTPEQNLLQRITQATIYGAIGAISIALLLGAVLARTLTQPVRELTAATQAVAQGRLGQQVVVRSRDELGTLAHSFNQMSADLAQANTLRRQMTADIAHDLRTPLSVILGYTEALRDGKLPPDQEMFDTLHTEAQLLQHLVDDLRTLSLADAGELPLNRQPLAPYTLLDRTAAAHQGQAQLRGIALQVRAPTHLPTIEADSERLAQVLGNLVSNALRYTPRGGTISLAAEQQAKTIQLRVQDTGSGIAPEELPHIFDRFYRGDAARQQDGSSGLGLAIAKGIVQAHGGRIAAESTVGQGTTFIISLPFSYGS